ncbi:unnamed protein product [Chironomus riparius]|uniref:Peptidase S1 domain-containing protein n=1 Tax=Chironomus riparius TaxID=315576 RepID=A0A9N9S0C7_9DIPT|nr:unnamed protein product [Chironomus riparius]
MFRQLLILAAVLVVALATPAVERDRRIVGGYDNVLGQVPWAVSLRTLAGFHFCTGSIVSTWYVLTGAHCISGRAASGIHLVMGRVTLDGSGGINRQGLRTVINPNFNAETMAFDLGLVQTSVVIVLSTSIQSIFLGNTFVGSGAASKSSGWGSTSSELGPTSNNLRTFDTTTLTNAECRARHSYWNAERITDNNLCTDNGVGEGFCQTGAGGSLVWNAQLIGVASWNVPCALGFPDVYVRVSALRPWIISIIGGN